MSQQAGDRKATVVPGEPLQRRLLSLLDGEVAMHISWFFPSCEIVGEAMMGRSDVWSSGKASQPSSCEPDLEVCSWHGFSFSTSKQLSTRREGTLWLRYRLAPGTGWSLDGIL